MRKCGICRNVGHNRATCQTNKKGESPQTVNMTPRKASCGYCKKTRWEINRTHTKTNCPVRKADREEWIEANSTWAYGFKEQMIAHGMGIGALVQYGNEDDVYVVTSIDFENVSKEGTFGYLAERLSLDEHSQSYFRSTYIPAPSDSAWGSKVVSKIPQSVVENQFPRDWGYGIYGIPRHLKDSKRKKNKKSDR